jgi:cyclic beta-1,2-glucan synthetase
MSTTSPGLVLGFFPEHDAAREIARRLKRAKFRRVALLHKNESGKVTVEQDDVSDEQGAIWGGVAGLILTAVFPLARAGRAIPVLAGTAAGYGMAHVLDAGVSDSALDNYRQWVIKGETLVIVETRPADMQQVLTTLRSLEGARPTAFVVRPQHLQAEESAIAVRRAAESVTSERLREQARESARRHHVNTSGVSGAQLLRRLDDNARVIAHVHEDLAEAARLEQPVSLSAEWLLDNAYIIQGQVLEVRGNLSRAFYRELPVIERRGRSDNAQPYPEDSRSTTRTPEMVPRVYAIAAELISLTDNRIDRALLLEYIGAYQEVAPLSIGELWALPLMLRLALIENLRRLFVQTDRRQRDRERADFWANRLLSAARREPDLTLHLLSALSTEQADVRAHFADRLVSQLYDEGGVLTHVLSWLERKLDAPFVEIVAREQRRQAADQVAVSNAIGSQRLLNQLDWREIFEELSLVEKVLRDDPAQIHDKMDFATRNLYRSEVEKLAKGSGHSEIEVAQQVVELSRRESDRDARASHIGFYLVDGGAPQFAAQLKFVPTPLQAALHFARENPLPLYLGGMALVAGGGLGLIAVLGRRFGARGALRVLGPAALLPAGEIGTQIVNYLVTQLVPPRALPKMDFAAGSPSGGIPDQWSTLVGVPMMFDSIEGIQELVDRLEVHYLANAQPQLRFALLADYTDATQPSTNADSALLKYAKHGIEALNARYAGEDGDRFFLFHRTRRWCASEGKWMGWERKRGKLEQLNAYLLGEYDGRADALHPVTGDPQRLRGIRFVLTLDADAQLPHDAARHLIEAAAHPLNRPVSSFEFRVSGSPLETRNPKPETVDRGYAIIQPRVSTSLPSATATRFSRLFTDPSGADPYTHVVSDVYFDLFGESSYQGKGIYDVAVFHRVLNRRFPHSHVLSHDLIEGAHVRAGLASDIELYDEFPPNYDAYARREHRWIRGDWQIADWIFPTVPTADGRAPNPLSGLNRWKIADNLRRSLLAPASVALLLRGWLASPGSAVTASAFVVLCRSTPALLQLCHWLSHPPRRVAGLREAGKTLAQGLATAALLPHQASLSLDAIGRVLFRRSISGKNLLEWQTAAAGSRDAKTRQRTFLRKHGRGTAFALGVAGVLLLRRSAAWRAASPFLVLWASAPLLVKWLGTETRRSLLPSTLPSDETRWLRRAARRTWRYFDDFVGPQTNWLPPDNYQESLNVEIAQRTSPTNIGLWLQATVAAYDFGYLPVDDAIGRALPTLRVFDELEKFRGHLLNWYGTQTLEALHPRYVSTVDSGNLLGSLMTVSQGVREMLAEPILDAKALRGLQDALAVLRETVAESDGEALAPSKTAQLLAQLHDLLETETNDSATLIGVLRAALPLAENLTRLLVESAKARREKTLDLQEARFDPRHMVSEPVYWAVQIEQQLQAWIHAANRYAQWLEWLAEKPEAFFAPLGEEALLRRREALAAAPSLDSLAHGDVPALTALCGMREQHGIPPELRVWLEKLEAEFGRSRWLAGEMVADAEELTDRIGKFCGELDMKFLFDPQRKLYPIGFSVEEMRHDTSYYDLLPSECRLASFLAIARDEVPVEHWWNLGRRYGQGEGGEPVLLSWSGTMFEYLMPMLYQRAFDNSLLAAACRDAVREQQLYARRQNIPWGISEAAFSALDAYRIYQYKAFGVPSLGLQRGHESDLVVAPYASFLALAVAPQQAIENLKTLQEMGAYGPYGFYEAVDFSRLRLTDAEEEAEVLVAEKPDAVQGEAVRGAIVRAYMVHHQGMTFLALDNFLHRRPADDGSAEIGAMQARFHSDPIVRAATPLLYERIPVAPSILKQTGDELVPARRALPSTTMTTGLSRFYSHDTPFPRVHLLSNGQYSVMVTNAGSGYVRWRDFEIARWRSDTTADDYGSYFYLRDVESGATWSATHQPLRRAAREASVEFKPERAEFRRRDAEIETITDVFVSPEDDVEVRRLTIVNYATRTREVEITSYVELAMAPHNADRAHPAFSKLFVETEALPEKDALLAFRRARSTDDAPLWTMHLCVSAGNWKSEAGNGNGQNASAQPPAPGAQYETDRAKFIGRNRSVADPIALDRPLSNTAGAVLDPIFAIRRRITIRAGERLTLSFVTGAGESREHAMGLIEKYSDPAAVERALELAWTHAQLEMHHLRIRPEDEQLFQQLASGVLYAYVAMRAPAARLRENHLKQSDLWGLGISGDLPIFIVVVDHERDFEVVRQALMAHSFWRLRGLQCDLIILNQKSGGYQQELSEKLKNLIAPHLQYVGQDKNGGIFVRARETMSHEVLTLLMATAHIVLIASRGRLAQQLSALPGTPPQAPRLALPHRPPEEPSPPLSFMELPYFNGLGGFTEDGREYAIYLGPRAHTPAPWINVMANPGFGCLVSETGQGFTWQGNSQSNRLTDWSNDPVSDPINDAIYIRDDDTGTIWTPTAGPIRELDAYRTRHGQGYTIYEHNSHAIVQELLTFVPVSGFEFRVSGSNENPKPIRVQRLRLRNVSSRPRRLTITGYHEWVLGSDRENSQTHVVTQWDSEASTLLAHNAYNPDFGHCTAFATSNPLPTHFTADRTAFLGRNGKLSTPAVLRRKYLMDRVGAGLDPCAAIQFPIELAPGESCELIFLMGQACDLNEVRGLVEKFRDPHEVEAAFQETRRAWDEVLGALQVETPILSVNFLLNRWLPYQNLSCRVWGRSAFYQSGGAWGFRDQLQDVMALVYSLPHLVREQILRAARHQFEEGDVQHWWHQPSGAGVRTRITDDLLFLPYVTAHYISVTGDAGVLDEEVPFLHAPPLKPEEHEKYFTPEVSAEKATIFEHCIRAIEKGSTSGPHGLPLIGTGDWNDGLNLVGEGGQGESVWLAWFLGDVLRKFADIAAARGEKMWARKWRTRATRIVKAVEEHAWDGAWYRRAYYDDGTPLGSRENDEMKIDSLPQSWSAITGAGDPQRVAQALASASEHLVKTDDKMILLFEPPFDKTPKNPGYIKGYLPGVRENGGQYTHGAIWLALAHATRGEGDEAVKLLQLLNPVEHARDNSQSSLYKVEPYVVAADVYALENQIGRGGWTWYTGSAGWMYRAWIEGVLGFTLRGDKLFLNPAIPVAWKKYSLRYRYKSSTYEITVENPEGVNRGVAKIALDGEAVNTRAGGELFIPLRDDGQAHSVRVVLGQKKVAPTTKKTPALPAPTEEKS